MHDLPQSIGYYLYFGLLSACAAALTPSSLISHSLAWKQHVNKIRSSLHASRIAFFLAATYLLCGCVVHCILLYNSWFSQPYTPSKSHCFSYLAASSCLMANHPTSGNPHLCNHLHDKYSIFSFGPRVRVDACMCDTCVENVALVIPARSCSAFLGCLFDYLFHNQRRTHKLYAERKNKFNREYKLNLVKQILFMYLKIPNVNL